MRATWQVVGDASGEPRAAWGPIEVARADGAGSAQGEGRAPGCSLRIASGSCSLRGGRRTNADWLVERPPLFAVADGFGTEQLAGALSRVACREAVRLWEAGSDPVGAVERANGAVFAVQDLAGERGCGTTLALVELLGGRGAELAWVGDSAVLLVRPGERGARRLTSCERTEGARLSSALGVGKPLVRGARAELAAGDIVVLATDGAWEPLGDLEEPAAGGHPESGGTPWRPLRVRRLDEERVEQIAVLEHERWRAEREALGWTWAPEKDAARKTNPNLVAFYRLDEATREWNRAFARRLPQLLAESGFAIVEARPWRPQGGDTVEKLDAGEKPAEETGAACGCAGETARPPADSPAVEAMARALFDAYNDHLRRDGKPVAYERFDDQPATLRRSCVEQALGFWDKAPLLGCDVVRADDPRAAGPQRVEELAEGQIETLARAEHDRWVAEREADGWTWAPVKDVEAKTSPYLVPYDELTEEIKDYDREPMRALVAQLAAAGYALVRR